MNDVTRILVAVEQGDSRASEQLLPLVYQELRALAARRLAQEQPGQTLQATALVHEAYVHLVQAGAERHWDSRGHFFAAAAEAMRRILVDQARRKRTERHGGRLHRCSLDSDVAAEAPDEELLALDEALTRFAAEHPEQAELVKLRYFAGLSIEDAARAQGISPATAKRRWAFARAWLFRAITAGERPSS